MGKSGQRKGGWRQRSRQQVYGNQWIEVYHDEVLTPAGTEGIYGVVHFRHLAVGVVALDEQQRVALVRQYRYPLERDSWEIPEGGCPEGEAALHCAQRELQEEAGLLASHWQPLLELDLSNSVTDERAVVFEAGGLSEVERAPEDSELDMVVERVPLVEALQRIASGEIRDAISVAALYAVAARRGVSLPESKDRRLR